MTPSEYFRPPGPDAAMPMRALIVMSLASSASRLCDRTNVRTAFAKNGGNLGASGSVRKPSQRASLWLASIQANAPCRNGLSRSAWRSRVAMPRVHVRRLRRNSPARSVRTPAGSLSLAIRLRF